MKWQQSTIYATGWDSDDGRFRIIPLPGGVWLLIDFDYTTDGEFWRKQFGSLAQAQERAEHRR
jgi:hypothetical protein